MSLNQLLADQYKPWLNVIENTVQLNGTSNQIVLQPANAGTSVSLSMSANPASSYTLALRDAGGNCDLKQGRDTCYSLTATSSIDASASGSQFVLTSSAAAVSVALPLLANAKGFRVEIVNGSSSQANIITLAFPASSMNCVAIASNAAVNGNGFTAGLAANSSNLLLQTTGKKGDRYTITCPDGLAYYVTAIIDVAASLQAS